jgi:hypothetical protein
MNAKQAITSQYLAALEMLKQAIAKCPDALWDDPGDKNRFWRVAYHALFYTHLYLQTAESDFKPWSGYRQQYQYLGSVPWPPHAAPEIGEPYGKADVLTYVEFCKAEVRARVAALDLESASSGFDWLPFGKLELQLYNLRHLQQHAGELMERLWTRGAIEVEWVGRQSD